MAIASIGFVPCCIAVVAVDSVNTFAQFQVTVDIAYIVVRSYNLAWKGIDHKTYSFDKRDYQGFVSNPFHI